MNPNNKIFCAEVVGSNLSQVTIVAWQYDQPFAYGSLVAIEQTLKSTPHPFVVSEIPSGNFVSNHNGQRTIFAIISNTSIGSDDPSRKPFAYKLSKEELAYQQPQIFSVIQTTMTGIVVGYEQDGIICHMVAPEPAEIHSFVRPATNQEVQRFVTKSTYLQLLFSANSTLNNVDELLLALVRYLKSQSALSGQSLQEMVGTYSLLTGNDYRRLKLLLSRMQQLL